MEQQRLSRTLGVLYPEHENLSIEDMKEGLIALLKDYPDFNWIIYDGGIKFYTYFPSEAGLFFAGSRTLVPCRGHEAGFRVFRWNREEDDQLYTIPTAAWVEIRGLSIHHWNRMDINKLMIKFAHVIHINEDTSQKKKLDCGRVKVGCNSVQAVPSEFNVVLGSQFVSIKLKITHKLKTNNNPSVGFERISVAGRIDGSDLPSAGITNLLGGNKRSFTW